MKDAKNTPGTWSVVNGSTIVGPDNAVVAQCCGHRGKANAGPGPYQRLAALLTAIDNTTGDKRP